MLSHELTLNNGQMIHIIRNLQLEPPVLLRAGTLQKKKSNTWVLMIIWILSRLRGGIFEPLGAYLTAGLYFGSVWFVYPVDQSEPLSEMQTTITLVQPRAGGCGLYMSNYT